MRLLLLLVFLKISVFTMFAQTAASYIFSTSTGATLDPMTGATNLIGSGSNNGVSAVTNIGFSFRYENVDYTQFSVNSNGLIRLGGTVVSNASANNITAAADQPKIMPMWDNTHTGTDGYVRYVLTGTAPNRILRIEFKVHITNTNAATNSTYQVWLYESSNMIEFVYGAGLNPTGGATIGIGGLTETNYMARNHVTNHTAASTGGVNTIATWPESGRKYTFSRPQYVAQILSANTGPATWCTGETRNVTVTIKNVGSATWTDVGPDVNIGVKWNTNGGNWTDYHVRTNASGLAPGQTQTYTLTIQAKNATAGPIYGTNLAAGANNLTFDVVKEADCWFGWNSGTCGPGNTAFTTPAITITGTPIPTYPVPDWGDGVAATGTTADDHWRVYTYDNGTAGTNDLTYFKGYYTFTTPGTNKGFNTENYWSQLNDPSNAGSPVNSGNFYVGCPIDVNGNDKFTFVHKRKGFACGYYRIIMQLSDDGSELFVDGVSRWSGNHYKFAGGAPCGVGGCNTLVGYFYLDNNSTVELRTGDWTSDAYAWMDVTPIVTPPDVVVSDPGTIGNNAQNICIGNTPQQFTSTSSPSVTINGVAAIVPSSLYTYQWQSSTTGCSGWVDIPGATAATYTPPLVSVTTYYRRNVFLPCWASPIASSACATITLPPTSTALSGNNESATCLVNGTNWIHFYHSSGRYIGGINPQGEDLGMVTMTSYVDGTNALVPACDYPTYNEYMTSVMQRHWVITPTNQPTLPVVNVGLPFTNAELGSLVTASNANGNAYDNVSLIGDVLLSKYHGPANVNFSATDNCFVSGGNENTTLHNQTSNGDLAIPLPGFVATSYATYTVPDFSEFWLHGSNNNSPLPIELTSFAAICNEAGDEVDVYWTTASEHNASHFDVERSIDGSTWEQIGTVEAAGNSTVTQQYSLKDNDARGHSVIYYRLNQVDLDGVAKVYGPTSAECLSDQNGFELFPNPAGTEVTVLLNGEYSDETLLIFTDMSGKEIHKQDFHDQKGKLLTIDLRNFEPGVYLVRLIDGDTNSQFVRLVKQ